MLSINGSFFLQLAIVLVVMVGMNFLIFRPLARLRQRRTQALEGLEKDADALEKERADLALKYQAAMESEKNQIVAHKSGIKKLIDEERSRIIDQTRQKAEILLNKEQEDLKRDTAEASRFLVSQTRLMAEGIFSRIVGRPLATKQ